MLNLNPNLNPDPNPNPIPAISQSIKDNLLLESFLKAQGLVSLLSFYVRDDEDLMTVFKGLEVLDDCLEELYRHLNLNLPTKPEPQTAKGGKNE